MVVTRVRLSRYFGYIYLETDVETALKVLKAFKERRGAREDLEDSIRILENFDAFYELARKKYKEYIAPRKSEADMLSGAVTVDKIKLEVNEERRVVIVFDKRMKPEELVEVLRGLGLEPEGLRS